MWEIFMRQLISFFIAVLLIVGCSTTNTVTEVRMPSSLETPGCEEDPNNCIGQNVIGHFEKTGFGLVPYVGRVKSMDSGFYEVDNELPCSTGKCSVKTRKVFKEVKCMDGVCSGERAVDANGKEYEVRSVFSNGEVLADQGDMNVKIFLKSKDLFHECNCLAGACRFDIGKTALGKRIEIERIYRNGIVGASSGRVEYNLKELGFPNECTNETPCSCGIGKI
jgi:hypothetical protein